jgi:hypothetical protein
LRYGGTSAASLMLDGNSFTTLSKKSGISAIVDTTCCGDVGETYSYFPKV